MGTGYLFDARLLKVFFSSFQFELEQKHSWFSIIVYLLISCLGSCVFLLPVDKGERTTFSCTIILADTIIFLYIRLYETYLTIGGYLVSRQLLISKIPLFIVVSSHGIMTNSTSVFFLLSFCAIFSLLLFVILSFNYMHMQLFLYILCFTV